MKAYILLILVILANPLIAQDSTTIISKETFSIGETVKIKSEILNQNRIVNIYLPTSYQNNTDAKYPVIYLLDGSKDEDFIHIAGIVQFGSFSWINMLPETIVVGISNIDRRHDYTFPTNNKQDKIDFPTTGSSDNFISFIEKELQPFINHEYRVNSTKTLIGQSLGGLLATEILLKRPNLFNNFIIVSPSLWWDDESLLAFKSDQSIKNKSIFIAVGKEGEYMERGAKKLHSKLIKEHKTNKSITFKYYPKLDHGDALHISVYDAFNAIFRQDNKN